MVERSQTPARGFDLSYDFDEHGNWIKRYQKRTGVSDDSYDFGKVGTLIRTITYYGK